jgi:hypothetical protein
VFFFFFFFFFLLAFGFRCATPGQSSQVSRVWAEEVAAPVRPWVAAA